MKLLWDHHHNLFSERFTLERDMRKNLRATSRKMNIKGTIPNEKKKRGNEEEFKCDDTEWNETKKKEAPSCFKEEHDRLVEVIGF